ncbi:MAG: radical SAM protein [Dehalococcoidia bacterium]|jgi:radical SAM protein with 4Fe4S-binding SPASM domain
MLSISRLLCDEVGPGDYLRYRDGGRKGKPIVVWNCTDRCNLKCVHCYSNAGSDGRKPSMTTGEGKAFIRQLSDFGVPVLLFSGGEPLLRDDFLELARYAVDLGLGVVVSTNGTLITPDVASQIKSIGFREVGISLDGVGEINDRFRGMDGAYEAALEGIRNCKAAGQRVSLRMTLTKSNVKEVDSILNLAEKESIDRVCFYHLAYSGRGSSLVDSDLSHKETRRAVDLICERTVDFYRRGLRKEVLTVGNHADGVYLYLKLMKSDRGRADKALDLLRSNGGNNSGVLIGAVDAGGNVHPDQFWSGVTFGNVRERPFGEIWQDTSHPLMVGLKSRKSILKGRCAGCAYIDICNGNLRSRAEAVYGDVWAHDPACYLSDEEIGIVERSRCE